MEQNAEGTLTWKSEVQQSEELIKRVEERKSGEGRDGFILSADGKFKYRGISYLVKVLRYFNHTNKFVPLDSQRISDQHAVVEFPDETTALSELVSASRPEFLWHDTLHSRNDKQTIEEQIEESHNLAKSDIDAVFTGEIIAVIEDKIKELNKEKNKILELTKENKK